MLGNSEHFYFKKKNTLLCLKNQKLFRNFPFIFQCQMIPKITLNFEIMVHKLYHFKLRILTKQNL